jgi:hypothetical protein
MRKWFIVILLAMLIGLRSLAQAGQILQLRNCQKEMRVSTYQSQVVVFYHLVGGWTTLQNQKWIKFSPNYKVDTASIEKQIEQLRKRLPVNYFKTKNLTGESYDNFPNEEAVWFTVIFSNGGSSSPLKIYGAIKILFTGNDARVDSQRSDPQIENIEVITDSDKLKVIQKKLLPQALAG